VSLILDALRQSKQQVGPPSADDTLTATSKTAASKRPAGVVGIGVGVILGVALVMLWQWGFDRAGEPSQVESVSVDRPRAEVASIEGGEVLRDKALTSAKTVSFPNLPAPSQSTSDGPPRDGEMTRPATNENERVADREQIASLHQQMWADAQSADLPQSEFLEEQAAAPVERNVGEASQQVQKNQSIAPSVDLAKAMEKAARELGESTLTPHPVPLLESLSQQQKDRIPTIVYTNHDYRAQGASTVELTGKRLGDGQRTGGVVVEEILSDSVILSLQGTRFRLKALNTWVNL
jgi:general secretion pathway protein B